MTWGIGLLYSSCWWNDPTYTELVYPFSTFEKAYETAKLRNLTMPTGPQDRDSWVVLKQENGKWVRKLQAIDPVLTCPGCGSTILHKQIPDPEGSKMRVYSCDPYGEHTQRHSKFFI